MTRRIITRIAIGLAVFGGILALSGAAIYYWGRTDTGRAWFGARLAGLLSVSGGRAVAIGRLNGDPFDAFRLANISVSDRKGVWLRIDSAEVRWRPWALLRDQVSLERLHVNTMHLLRAPVEDARRQESPGLIETIRGLRRYRLDEGDIAAFELDPAVTGEKAVFQVRVSLRADQGETVRSSLEISRRDGKKGRATAALALAPSGESLDLTAAIDEPANGLIARALEVPGRPPLRIRVDGHGPLEAWEGKANLSFESLAALSATFTLRNRDSATTEYELTGDGILAGTDTASGNAGWRPLLGDRLEWRMTGTVDTGWRHLTVTQARATGGFGVLTGFGRYDNTRGEGRAAITLRKHDLTRLAAKLEMPIAGHVDVKADVEIKRHGRSIAARLHGEADSVATGQAVLDRLLTPTPRIAGKLTLTPETLSVTGLALTSDAVKLQLDGTAQRDGWTLDAAYRLIAPAAVSIPLSDGVEIDCRCVLTGKIAGPLADPHTTGTVAAAALRAGSAHVQSPNLEYRLRNLAGATEGVLEATAETPLGPLRGHAGLKFAGDRWQLAGLHAENGKAVLDGDLAFPKGGGPVDGALKIALPTLSPWLRLAGLAGDGNGELRATLQRNGERQAATVDGALTTVRIEGNDGARLLQADRLAVKAVSRDLGAGKLQAATLDLHALVAGDGDFRRIRVQLGGSKARIDVTATAEGDWNGPLSLKSTFAVAPVKDGARIEVSRFDGRVLDAPVRLTKPLRLAWRPGSVIVDQLTFSFGKARFTGRLNLENDSIRGTGSLDRFPLDLAGRLGGMQLAGNVTGRFSLEGTRAAPSGTLSAKIAALRLPEQPSNLGLAVSVNGRWNGGRLALEGEMPGTGKTPSRFTADLPLRFVENSWKLAMPSQAPVSGSLTWRGDAAALWRFVPLAEHELAGNSVVDMQLRGTMGRPELHGAITVSNGRYESLQLGTVLKDLDLRIAFDGARATIAHFAARDGNGGKVSLVGGLTLDAAADFPFDLQATFAKFVVLRRDEFRGAASGTLRFKGTFRTAAIDGNLKTEWAEIRILEHLPPDVVELNVTEVAGKAGVTDNQPKHRSLAFDPTLAIKIEMPRRVFIRGRGVDSEWKGQLVLGGTVLEPRLRGEVEIVRGQVTVVGKAFTFQRGTVRFPDRLDASPVLDITAVHQGRRLTAQAQITGPVRNPKVALTSTPPLPPDEIVSQILFDKGASHLTRLEAAQLAIALAQLSGKGGVAGSAMEFARKTLGVDVLRLEETRTVGGESTAAVRAGKYLSKDIYVGVKQGTTTESGSVGVEVEVTPNIVVESEVKRSGESDTSVKFKLDY